MGLFCVSGCASPSPHFRGAEVTRITVDGAVFDVRHKGRLAEAVRRNVQFAPNLRSVAPQAEAAMRAATGCEVVELRGDAAQIVGVLRCDAHRSGGSKVRIGAVDDCEVVDVFVPSGSTTGYLEAECT